MCLGIPVKVIAKNDDMTATVELSKVKQQISLQVLPEVEVGDYVILHAGFAIQKLNEQEAMETLNLINEVMKSEIH